MKINWETGEEIPEGYCLYAHVNPTNDKVYIGLTDNIKQRWRSKEYGYRKCTLIYNAFKKYGWDHFKHVILFDGMTKEEACQKEMQWIKAYKSVGLSYNITDGGEGTKGVHRSERHKQILRERMTGHIVTQEQRKAISRKNREHNIKAKKIYAFNIHTKELVKEYPSINEAAREIGILPQGIIRAAKGGRPSAAGFIWRYSPTINKNNPLYTHIGSNKPKKVYCYNLYGNFERTYESSKEAIKDVGGIARGINACCAKEIVSYKHHIWRYELCEIESEVLNKIRFKRHEASKS